jgi:hypothetical protein
VRLGSPRPGDLSWVRRVVRPATAKRLDERLDGLAGFRRPSPGKYPVLAALAALASFAEMASLAALASLAAMANLAALASLAAPRVGRGGRGDLHERSSARCPAGVRAFCARNPRRLAGPLRYDQPCSQGLLRCALGYSRAAPSGAKRRQIRVMLRCSASTSWKAPLGPMFQPKVSLTRGPVRLDQNQACPGPECTAGSGLHPDPRC